MKQKKFAPLKCSRMVIFANGERGFNKWEGLEE
jgi:hypothetical protein